MQPEHRFLAVGGARLAIHEWGRQFAGKEPTILLVHATGFHGRCWEPVIAFLGERHILAPDLPGSGLSEARAPFNWKQLAADLCEIIRRLHLKGVTGAGHSLGGYLTANAAADIPEAFQSLLLIDPVILDPDLYHHKNHRHSQVSVDDHPVTRRHNDWSSWHEMYERLAARSPFRDWVPEALAAYCRYGIRPKANGTGFVLACSPRTEATLYTSGTTHDPYGKLSRVKIPVTILRAPPGEKDRKLTDFSGSPTWPQLHTCFPAGKDLLETECTHFIPMEKPRLIADLLLSSEPGVGS